MKYALITGSATGLGLTLCQVALQKGYTVFGTYRNNPIDSVLQEKYPDALLPVLMDVSNEKSVQKGMEYIQSVLAGDTLDILINNAAMIKAKPIIYCNEADLVDHFKTNVVGPFSLIKYCFPLLEQGSNLGKILNVNSLAGQLSLPFQGAYAISKSGLSTLSDMIRFEQMPLEKIQISDLWLGMLQTDVHQRNVDNSQDWSETPYGDWANKMKERVANNQSLGFTTSYVAEKIFDIIAQKKLNYRYLITQSYWKVRLLLLLGNRPIVMRLIRRTYFG